MSLFPIIQPQVSESVEEVRLYKEVKWDFETNTPIFVNGSPVIVSGKEAVIIWAWKALQVQRFRHEIYTWDYGCETDSLIGQPYTGELKQAEATRFAKECLLINPYITDVTDITALFEGEDLQISCTIETIYGEERINV